MQGVEHGQFAPPAMQPLTLGEITSRRHHDPVDLTGTDLIGSGDIDMAAFMEEMVGVYVHPTDQEGAIQVIEPGVNGVKQPLMRGKEQFIRRKYVEALISGYSVKYTQNQGGTPDDISTVPTATVSYPFSVTKDTERGRVWLRELTQRPL